MTYLSKLSSGMIMVGDYCILVFIHSQTPCYLAHRLGRFSIGSCRPTYKLEGKKLEAMMVTNDYSSPRYQHSMAENEFLSTILSDEIVLLV